MERMKLAAVALTLFTALGMAACQRETPSGAPSDQGAAGDQMQRDQSGAPSDATGAPSGGPMGGSSGDTGAGAPPSGTQ